MTAQVGQPRMSALDESTASSPCHLFSITQYECERTGNRVDCWPFERIFRQCGKGPALEVTNRIISPSDVHPVVDPKFILMPPKGKKWDEASMLKA